MKSLISICLLLLCLSTNGNAINMYPFAQDPISSIDRALGYGYVGVADVWHQSPLIAWDNPAMPAMHDGIAIGFSQDKSEPVNDYYNTEYHSSFLTIGYKGIGIITPFYNAPGEWGTYISYDPNFNEVWDGYSRGYNNATIYGISINPFKFLREQRTENHSPDDVNVAIGVIYQELVSKWDDYVFNVGVPVILKYTSHTIDIGLLADKRIVSTQFMDLKASLGYKKFNIEDNSYKSDEGIEDPIGNNDVVGAGLELSFPVSKNAKNTSQLSRWCDNYVTGRLLASKNFSDNISEETSGGVELGLFDVIYLRGGYNYNHKAEEEMWTRGIGIRLHYQDIVSFEGNYARFPLYGTEDSAEESWDFMLSLDVLGISHALAKE